MSRIVQTLRDTQARAADPASHAWVSASAGTGKTQVLTARVLRLLLDGVRPDRILCLTFTRAAAAEMQDRIYGILAGWLHADDASLTAQLQGLRAAHDADACTRARQLFATVLDARGGLRIQTLHSYAQSLLASFPLEAGIAPGFRLMDDRTGAELRHRALIALVETAEAGGVRSILDDLAALAVRLGEVRVHEVTATLLQHGEAIQALGPIEAIDARLRQLLDLPLTGDADLAISAAVGDGSHEAGLHAYAMAMADWNVKTGLEYADIIRDWLMAPPAGRVASIDKLMKVFLKSDGGIRALKGKPAKDDGLAALHVRLADWLSGLSALRSRFDLLDHAGVHLRVGWRLASVFARDKARTGGLAFDDMITGAARLLCAPGMAEWVRYKLDQSIDHILVDEAQDTNAAQWTIIDALAAPFFAGEGAVDRQRTLFAVGDFKQAIFSFQGTDPTVFAAAETRYRDLANAARAAFQPVPLSDSFRSTQAVLSLVDAMIAHHGGGSMGLDGAVPPHQAARKGVPGQVVLWDAVRDPRNVRDKAKEGAHNGAGDGTDPDGALRFVPGAQTLMAQKLAAQIAGWLDPASPDRLWLGARGRYAAAGDILILVRKRGNFVPALVAELHRCHVPIAGVDRLRLVEPIGVQDCLSLIRFALQPGDDLALATLLTSPFIGWSQEQLFALAHGRRGSLWRQLRDAETPHGLDAKAWLGRVLDLADFTPPYEFLETILSGPLDGRARLLARLGEEARDAIDTLVTQALMFEADHPPSLQGFLNWIESDTSELKRDPESAGAAVRIMTVHGAKGLQAPVVVLADAAHEKDVSRASHALVDAGGVTVPVFADSKMRASAPVVAAAFDQIADKLAAEDWRLLYVALTRAEDMLFIGGALGRKEEAPKPDSWHARLQPAFAVLGAEAEGHALWGGQIRYDQGDPGASAVKAPDGKTDAGTIAAPVPMPGWALSSAPPESTPPRPLSPSQLGRDDSGTAPPSPAALRAAERGRLLHSLFEKLPAVSAPQRAAVAARWLETQATGFSDAERDRMAQDVLAMLDDPALADIFGADALVEAPLTAVVGSQVIAGTVDRLCIAETRVTVVDYKTGLAIPATVAAVPRSYLIQMAAYRAALRRIFPDRTVAATLIYTSGPRRFDLSDELLDSVLASIEPERAPS